MTMHESSISGNILAHSHAFVNHHQHTTAKKPIQYLDYTHSIAWTFSKTQKSKFITKFNLKK